MQSTGICLGAATLSLVTVEKDGRGVNIIDSNSTPHEGNPRSALLQNLNQEESMCLCVTGRKFRHLLDLPNISEPEAVELACQYTMENNIRQTPVDGVVTAGSETFIFYELNSSGEIRNVYTGNKCASGSGEFFLQQIKRMGLNPSEAIENAAGEEPYTIAGRCSVFSKSDCTHALNKGERKEKVVAGLCYMLAGKIMELVRKAGAQRILLVGGVSKNQLVVDMLRKEIEVIVPPEAPYFEALGAALWGIYNDIDPLPADEEKELFNTHSSSFNSLPSLKDKEENVIFKEILRSEAAPGDNLLLGLDVGSTTTKAALVRKDDHALVGSVYLYTHGNPVEAARKCYKSLSEQVPEEVKITALGVTGSGRQIAALHALTPAVINEIIAHATAALYFDPEVETIFEIGGQDAKYTHIINGVPVDYAMNEACSAGTGSFLEEAAGESLEVEMTNIAPLALEATYPPNFNDQCAAFISSDIKTAVQEGIKKEDILAGLVYSICLNYLTRVKGNRPEGQKIFMQGGVCYNRAVPVAMASLLERDIVVPPEPGLMGAFGVALAAEEKLNNGLIIEEEFDLNELAERELAEDKPFTCKGEETCDRQCTIRTLRVKGKRYPFGGACSRYTVMQNKSKASSGTLNLVFKREQLIFQQTPRKLPEAPPERAQKKIGLTHSLLSNTLYPLYFHFFSSLGFEVVTSSHAEPEGRAHQGAPFCFPVELAHGYMADLLQKDVDHIFLPQVKGLPSHSRENIGVTCPLSQGEPYYLKATFPQLRLEGFLLTPVLDFSRGLQEGEEKFVDMGIKLGVSRREAKEAFHYALEQQEKINSQMKEWGQQILSELEKDPQKKAVVLFGRSYNAFTREANLGIPHKFASRGWSIIPCDFLPYEQEEPFHRMYWANGQLILQAANFVQKHPQLFGVFITNFSCGPDSFILGYFREIMGNKPSLTLELDEHSADAGLDTRVEAFLDIVSGYLESPAQGEITEKDKTPQLSSGEYLNHNNKTGRIKAYVENKWAYVELPDSSHLPLNHPQVKLLIPSMGELNARLVSAAVARKGIRTEVLPSPGEKEIKLARAHITCKECLPLQLTVGSLLRYLNQNGQYTDEQLIYFMPDASGPCRFGQYSVFMNRLMDRLGIKNVTTLSLSAENGYGGLGLDFTLRAWMALVIADVMHEIYNSLLVAARNKESALAVYNSVFDDLTEALQHKNFKQINNTLYEAAQKLSSIEKTGDIEDFPKVALVGEIYVRHDSFSCQEVIDYLAQQGIITKVAPIHEWLYYCDYLLQKGISPSSLTQRIGNRVQGTIKSYTERKVKQILSQSGLYQYHPINMEKLISKGKRVISPELKGEAILTVSTTLQEIIDETEGAIAIGPFGCMPNRMAEAITGKTLEEEKKNSAEQKELVQRVFSRNNHLPFMAIETDGSVLPQVVQARLESFALQVKRLHEIIKEEKEETK